MSHSFDIFAEDVWGDIFDFTALPDTPDVYHSMVSVIHEIPVSVIAKISMNDVYVIGEMTEFISFSAIINDSAVAGRGESLDSEPVMIGEI